jgi:glycosyltransferase involved in cell wall biosynthesis
VEAKGLLLLAEALPRFPRIRLITAGRGPLDVTLRKKLGPQWIDMGPLESAELAGFYQAGDYVILPSLTTPDWKEQIGRSLIEGILCGCAALGSDSGHIPELTLDPRASFRQGDVESLAALLGRLPLEGAEALRERQHRNVTEKFTASAVARSTWEFLAEAEQGNAEPRA